jgi:hypothetical protein
MLKRRALTMRRCKKPWSPPRRKDGQGDICREQSQHQANDSQKNAPAVNKQNQTDYETDGSCEKTPTNINSPRQRRIWSKDSDPIVRLTGWVATFTWFLAIFALGHWYSFIISERPFLSLAEVRFPFKTPLVNMQPLQLLIQVSFQHKLR